MIKPLSLAALALWAAALAAVAATPATTFTQTNVLENVSLQLTLFQQGATSARKIADQVTSYNTKSLINQLSAVTGQSFGANPKLVYATDFSNAAVPIGQSSFSNVLSTSIPVATNGAGSFFLSVGGIHYYGVLPDTGVIVIDGNTVVTNGGFSLSSDVITNVGSAITNSITINTNSGYITTITPQADGSDNVTNATIVTQFETAAPTENLLTNVSSGFYVLYGTANNLLPVNNYLGFATNSAEIVVESGINLDTTNPGIVSQTGVSIQSLNISNYNIASGTNGLTLNLQGFVKQALKLDTLYSHGTNKIVEYIFGASSTWNVNGSGFIGGSFVTNGMSSALVLTNGTPVVADGTVNISFLKNLPQP